MRTGSFPGRVWRSKVGSHFNMLCSLNGTGCWARYTSSDPRLMRWKLADKSFVRNGHAPYCDAGAMFHRIPGGPADGPTHLINANTGSAFMFGKYDEQLEIMTVVGSTVIDSSLAYQWAAVGRNGPDPMADTGRLLTVAWINWQGWSGWDGYRTSAISLPRELRWDAAAEQLVSFPVRETALLHNATFLAPSPLGVVAAGSGKLTTLPIPPGRGGAVDISLSVELPSGGGFGLAVRAPAGTTDGAALRIRVEHITAPDPLTGARNLTASFTPLQTVPVSGTSVPANVTVPVLKGEMLEIRIFVDRPIVEAFLMGGRGAYTSTDEKFTLAATSVHVYNEGTADVVVRNASVFGMGCGWAKAKPRPAAKAELESIAKAVFLKTDDKDRPARCEAAILPLCGEVIHNFSRTDIRSVSAAACKACLQSHEAALAPACGGPGLPLAGFFCHCTIGMDQACGAQRNRSLAACDRCMVANNSSLTKQGCNMQVRWNTPWGRDGTRFCRFGREFDPGPTPPLPPNAVDPFLAFVGGYITYRIPSLNQLGPGKLLLIAEARKYSTDDMDHGWNDIVQKTSTDSGRSWSSMALIHSESKPGAWVTIGNPAPVVLHSHPGTVLLVASRNNKMAILLRSEDNATSWSKPRNLTNVSPAARNWTWIATGPPGGIQLPSGRVIVNCDHKKGPFNGGTGRETIFSHVMYSDNFGSTFSVSDPIPGGNECHSALTREGSLLMTMRTNTLSRAFAWSTTAGRTWSAPITSPLPYSYIGGQCESTMLTLPGPDRPLLLSTPFSLFDKNKSTNPKALAPPRANGSLFISYSSGHHWSFYRSIVGPTTGFGYSALSLVNETHFGLVFEAGGGCPATTADPYAMRCPATQGAQGAALTFLAMPIPPPKALAASKSDDGATFSVGSPAFNMTFDAASLALLSVATTSKSSGRTQNFLLPTVDQGPEKHSLWQLNFTDCRTVMPHGWDGHAWQLDSGSPTVNRSYTIASVPHGGVKASLRWLGVSSPQSLHLLDVTVTITVPAQGSSMLTMRGHVHKRGQPGICIQNMALPNLERMVLRSPQLDSLFVPWYFGQVGDLSHLCGYGLCTLDLWRSHMQNVDYPLSPNGQRSMQFMALYSRDAAVDEEEEEEAGLPRPLGLYIGAHNPKSRLNVLLMDGKYAVPDPHSAVRWLHMPDDLLDSSPETDFEMPYDIVMAGFEGDWFDAALIYRDWATNHAAWTQNGNLSIKTKSAGYPRWLTETPLWTISWGYASNPATDHGSHTHAADIKLRRLLGVPTATHWYGWEEEPFDTLYPQYSPFDNSSCGRFNKSHLCGNFSNTSRMLQAGGVNVVPYINGRLFDPRLSAWTEEAANDSACRQFSGAGRVGAPYWEKYEQHRNWSFAVMDPTSTYWQEKVPSVARAIQQAGNTSGIYIDQLASYYPQVCFSNRGRHGAAGSAWADGVRRTLHSAVAAVGPGKVIISESNNEAYIGSLHANLALYGWRECNVVPAYQAVYGGFIVNVGATGWPEPPQTHAAEYRALFAQQFIFGHVLGETYAGNILAAFSREGDMAFLRSLVQLKLSHAEYLVYGRLMRPPRISNLARLPETALCNGNGKYRVCCNYSAVVGQVWMAADRTVGLILANTFNGTAAVEIMVSVDALGDLAVGNLVQTDHHISDGIQRNESHTLRVGKRGLLVNATMQPLSARVVRISNVEVPLLKTDDPVRRARCVRAPGAPARLAVADAVVIAASQAPRALKTDCGGSSLEYVSWYSAYEYYHNESRLDQAPNRSFANLQMDRNLTFLENSHRELGLPGMINLRKSKWAERIWNYPGAAEVLAETQHPHPPPMLLSGWEAAVDEATATLLPLTQGQSPAIKMVMLGDELLEGGFPLSNLSALAARVRHGMGKSVLIYTNEAFAVGGACKTSADCKHPQRQVCRAHTCDAKPLPYLPPDIDVISSDQCKCSCSLLRLLVSKTWLHRRSRGERGPDHGTLLQPILVPAAPPAPARVGLPWRVWPARQHIADGGHGQRARRKASGVLGVFETR